jgi:hypothetical protein
MKSLMLSVVFLLSLTIASSAATPQIFVVRGGGTGANMFATILTPVPAQNCTITENVQIGAFDNVFTQVVPNNFESAQSLALVTYTRSGCGLPNYSFNSSGLIGANDFTLNAPQADKATLNATLTLTDSNNATFPVNITAEWVGIDKFSQEHDTQIFSTNPLSLFQFRQKERPAVATFSLSGYGVSVSGTSSSAQLLLVTSGNKLITP